MRSCCSSMAFTPVFRRCGPARRAPGRPARAQYNTCFAGCVSFSQNETHFRTFFVLARRKKTSTHKSECLCFFGSALAELRRGGPFSDLLKQHYCLFPRFFKAFRGSTSNFPPRVNPTRKLDYPHCVFISYKTQMNNNTRNHSNQENPSVRS